MLQDDFIMLALDLVDNNAEVTDVRIEGDTKFITISKLPRIFKCVDCDINMRSKGPVLRHPNHPIFQDGSKCKINAIERVYRCPNCRKTYHDRLVFLGPRKRQTNLTPYIICEALKDILVPLSHIADRFDVSDTYVFYTFLEHVVVDRAPLSEYLCIDEVFINFDYKHKYQLVLYDFEKKKTIDLLESRRFEDTNRYFLNIPREERLKVKYLITDMYKPYLEFTKDYFPNAVHIVDYFHVISYLLSNLRNLIYKTRKEILKKDKEQLEKDNKYRNKEFKEIKESKEAIILRKFKWVLLSNTDNIKYDLPEYYDKDLCMVTDTYKNEEMFFSINERFRTLRIYKELYVDFNKRNIGKPEEAAEELDELIEIYLKSDDSIIIDFAHTLIRYKKEIINSFICLKDDGETLRRLSNGLIESFNNIPKDFKRISNGVSDYEYARLRILWSCRNDGRLLSSPKKLKGVKNKKEPRGSYKKKNK